MPTDSNSTDIILPDQGPDTLTKKEIFKGIIEDFRNFLKADKSILKDFHVEDVINSNWVWISDAQRIIANKVAHYEITMGSHGLYVEIHFEAKKKAERDIFKNSISHLPEKAEWFKWNTSRSIRYPEAFSLKDENLNRKLRDALLYLEENLGNPIREIITKKIQIVHQQQNPAMNRIALNQILFGPPGTGKTFHTINKALQILGEDIQGKEREEIKNLFDEKVKAGQIVFTTFHQSMTYEDFIEGIKPITPDKEGDPLIYKVDEGIFRRLCIEASFSLAKENDSIETENVLDFSLAYDNLVQKLEEDLATKSGVDLPIKNGGKITVDSISPQGNIVIKHKGGSRSYIVSKTRLTKLQKSIANLDDINNINNHFRSIIGGNNASAYWAVLNAIRKEKQPKLLKTEARNFTWEEKKEVVQSLKKQDFQDKQGKPHILIIDEINRGNVSQIFGELITLIEEDKRLGKKEALEVTLPYSKEIFGVPANLFIIGTMNTADRSVEALDTALRRRFSFVEMPPQYNLPGLAREVDGYKLSDILNKINRRIEKLLGKDNLIGHSYFLEVKDSEGLRVAFQNKIIPLLQEYFYGDYGKIGLLLGAGFFKDAETDNDEIFASFGSYDTSGLAEKEVYHLADLVGEGRLSDGGFKAALDALMR